MKQIKTYENKKVLVVGLAKSGVNAAKLLNQLGALVTVNDAKKFDDNKDAQDLLASGIRVITGGHPVELLDENFELIVKNPGIRYDNPIIAQAIAKKIPVITEIQLAYEVAECPWIGVTGTNGKTTTTTMISLILNQNRAQGEAYVAGNIGVPASLVAQKATKEDVMVTELSSFQLLGITTMQPKIAVITNLYTAHIDYHGSRAEYVKAKLRITQNQTAADYLIINWDQTELRDATKSSKAQLIPFSRQTELENGAYLKAGDLYFGSEKIIAATEIKVPGDHNVENALAAIAAAKLMGQTNENIAHVLRTFSGVEHRTQYVTTWHERQFYNDSKATNIEATEMALKGFKQPVVLLAGGLDRGFKFDELIPALAKHVTACVLFGETAHLLEDSALKAGIKAERIKIVADVEAAVPVAYALSAPKEIIILSPACASWDQYPSFEVRGDNYMAAITQLIEDEG